MGNSCCKNDKEIKEGSKNILNESVLKKIKEKNGNLLIAIYSGLLIKEMNFQNCLIKSKEELTKKLRMFIPSILTKGTKKNKFNIEDKILSNNLKINYYTHSIIALKEFNDIESVTKFNDNYLIVHKGQNNRDDRYLALVVKKIEGNPEIMFSPPLQN